MLGRGIAQSLCNSHVLLLGLAGESTLDYALTKVRKGESGKEL